MEVLLFTKPDCNKCDYVKEKIPKNLDIKIMDMTTPEEMAEAAFLDLLKKYTPILVVDGDVFEGAINIKNKMLSLANDTS